VGGLRVVDASVFPVVPCANTNIPVSHDGGEDCRRDAGGGVRAGLRRALNCDTCAMQPVRQGTAG